MESKTLENGNKIASIGFGTYRIKREDTVEAVVEAIKAGYRHIDTAQSYENEEQVGYAIAKCIAEGIVKREDLFITSKISSHCPIGYQQAIDAIESSLMKMGLDYIDCYLIHWPNVAPGAMWKKLNADTWRGFEQCYERGLVKNLGVSNFMIHHLEELFKTARIKPVVNQLHLSPIWQQKEVVAWCKDHGIQCVAWSPLVRFEDWAGGYLCNDDYNSKDDFTEDIMNEMSSKYGKSKAQIALRWSIQKGLIPITKSIHKDRIIENINIFDFNISDEDIEKLDTLNSRPCNPDATPDSIYNTWALAMSKHNVFYTQKFKFHIFGIPIFKYWNYGDSIRKITLFGLFPLLKIKRFNDKKTKYWLFNIIPILKSRKVEEGKIKYYLFSFLYLFKITTKTVRVNNLNFIPNYNAPVPPPSYLKKAPKWNPFKQTIFDLYSMKVFQGYMEEGRNAFKRALFVSNLKMRLFFTGKMSLPCLTHNITSNCTLKCKDCSISAPHYQMNYMADFESFKKDLDKVLESVDQVLYYNLFGGEPLLNPNIAKMIEYANSKKQIHHVFFTTNGTIIPSDETIKALKAKKGNFVYISNYTKNKSIKSLKQCEIIELLKKNNIPYYHHDYNFVSAQTINPDNRDKEKDVLKSKFYQCFNKYCKHLNAGRFYCCPICSKVMESNQYPDDKTNYIDLNTKKNLKKEFIKFHKRDFYKVCEVCDFKSFGYLRFPAIQLSEKEVQDIKKQKEQKEQTQNEKVLC